jgi:hypothetical protein
VRPALGLSVRADEHDTNHDQDPGSLPPPAGPSPQDAARLSTSSVSTRRKEASRTVSAPSSMITLSVCGQPDHTQPARRPGIVVSDRYQNYFSSRWEHVAGNQACLAHLIRDFEDCAETYPGAVWPVQARRALRSLTREWHSAAEHGLPAVPADALAPLEREFRHAVLAGLASVPRVPGPKTTVKQKPGRELLEFCKDRQADVLRFTTDTRIWPTSNDVTQDRLDIRSYIDTARKHGQKAMDVLHALMLGTPWRPSSQAFSP